MNSDKEIKSYDDVMTPDVLVNEEHKLHQDQSIDFNDELNSAKFVDSVNVCDELQQLHNTSSAINIDDLLKKKIKQQDRSNSTGKLYQSCRRVSFPVNDCDLVTGYLEPANPWATVKPIANVSELAEIYRESCEKHNTIPIESIIKHLATLDPEKLSRLPILNLREQTLTAESCEALEEVLKRVQYKLIDLTDCGLNDASAQALFEMIEYYEAANEVDISENRNITTRGWQSCINMIKRSHALQTLATRCTPLSESNAINLGKAMLGSSLYTLKLEHCGLSGRPIASLCLYLRRNTVLKELWLAHNDLSSFDASNIGTVLKANLHLQFLDISNNNIEDIGVMYITEALIEQAKQFKSIHGPIICSADVIAAKSHKISLSYDESMDVIELNKSISSINESTLRSVSETPPLPPPKRSVLETLLESHKYIESSNAAKDSKLIEGGDGDKDLSVDEIVPVDNKLQAIFEKSDSNSNVETSIVPFNPLELVELKKLCESPPDRDEIELKIVEEDELTETYADILKSSDDSDRQGKGSDGLIINDSSSNVNLDNNNSLLDFISDQVSCVEQPTSSVQTRENPILIDAATDTSFDINENNSTSIDHQSLNCNDHDLIIFDDKLPDEQVICQNMSNSTKSSKTTDSDLPIDSPCLFAAIDDDEDSVFMDKLDSTATSVIGQSTVIETPPLDIPLIVSRSPPLNVTTETPPATPQTPISPNLLSSADTHLFISDSSQSLDSIHELGTSFETKGFHISAAPERSFSSESLNSETSIDSNDSKSSIKLTEAKFSKNGTLERQSNNLSIPPATTTPSGLQVLVLWNNRITRDAAKSISDLLAVTSTLEILNVGRNVLSNDFLTEIKSSLKSNTSLTSLGLQSAHFTCAGMKTLSEIIEFGGNSTLQRIDLRDNHLQVNGLTSLNDAMKTNKSLTRIDLDDVPRRAYELGGDSSIDYSRMVSNIRAQCAHNENPPEPEPIRTSAMKRVRANMLNSRKISLTCQSIRHLDPAIQPKVERHLLDPNRKTGGRLRSPLPSPIPSPVSSPAPSPSRNRFHVSRVVEATSPITPPSSASCSPTFFPNTTNASSRFRVSIVEPPKQNPKFVYGNNSTTKDLTTAATNKTDNTPSANSIPITTIKQPPIEHVNISTASLLHSMSNSFDSPDMEVKQYMDDSCSSISSMDSMDRQRDFINTSMSSTESFDFVLPEHTKTTPLPQVNVKVNTFEAKATDTTPSNYKIHDSLSSSEANSSDSLCGSHDIPVPISSSNEGTLTNSPSSPSYPLICDKTIEGKTDLLAVKPQEKRVRTTSWISNPIAMAKSDGYPATLDKLLSIFQHPGTFFSRSCHSDGGSKSSKDTSPQNTESKPPSRKESPMGGLFAWTTMKKENPSEDPENRTTTESVKTTKSPLQSNLPPENVRTPTEPTYAGLIDSKTKQEMKENISPEHTITAISVVNIKSQIVEMRDISDKVHFEVGGDDEDDVIDVADEDDDDDDDDDDDEAEHLPNDSNTSIQTADLNASDAVSARSTTCPCTTNNVVTCNNKNCLHGLGQKTRDSLSIIKGHSKNSQDSMRSLESLTEVDKIESFVDAASSQ
ncbi:Protein phosphatase 1 regulatory subunit 37 [Pseudolycoriella hygida]|uniref:Protein phosphatase 1 regulatory subunit 37 n=1 Tax=Pseudolycoriella hygida TaxID=35572 RepID=A0A9Q0MXS8_9DIPT|nr:Protein phosphatase 1 regulatory subunit 37 [Pseudolycoriella hygida]